MASKAGQPEADKVDIEEALDYVDKTLDRTKVLYEQYFLGMQKQPPTQIHTDVERRLRDLQQLQIRNTGMRYRFATLQQKFGSYNSYWRRTLKQIENGTYIRNLQKISRKAAQTGDAIPEEILAAMPKRMREQVKRDREQALSIAKRRQDTHDDGTEELIDDESAAIVGEAPAIVRQLPRGGAHVLAADDADLDFEAFFASVDKADDTQESAPAYVEKPLPPPPRSPAPAAPHPRAPVLRHELSYDDDEATSFQAAPPPAPRATGQVTVQPPPPPPTRGTGSVPSGPQHPRAATVQPAPPTAPQRAATHPDAPGGPQYPRGVTEPGTAPAGPGQPRPGTPPPVPQRTTGSVPTQRPSVPMPAQAQRTTGPVPVVPAPAGTGPQRQTGPIPVQRTTGPIPTIISESGSLPTTPGQTQQLPTMPGQTQSIPSIATQRMPTMPGAPQRPSGPIPTMPQRTQPIPTIPSGPIPAIPARPRPGGAPAPSQISKPNPIAPGSSTARPAVPVETMAGPFPRAATPPVRAAAPPVNPRQDPPNVAPPRPQAPAQRPPPGMNDADVNALYATYVKAKQAVGEEAGPGAYGKLLKTINAQAPKIMEQYKAKGVEFSVVVKDNQVVIKAKPKT